MKAAAVELLMEVPLLAQMTLSMSWTTLMRNQQQQQQQRVLVTLPCLLSFKRWRWQPPQIRRTSLTCSRTLSCMVSERVRVRVRE
jgi:hypothetical protein